MNERCVKCGKPVSDMELVIRREWRPSCCDLLYPMHVPATIPAEALYEAPTAGLRECITNLAVDY